MRATQINLPRKLCMLVASIMILFSQGCNKSQSTPSPTQTLSPAATKPPSPAEPTATIILPTATVALSTSIPFGELMPEGALARLNLGAVEQIALSPTGDRLVAAGATHICLYDMAHFEKVWCTAASLQSEYDKWSFPEKGWLKYISSIAIRPDESQIVYALWYGAIVFLDGITGERLKVIDGDPQNSIKQLVWSEDNDHLVIWSSEGGVNIWDMATSKIEGHVKLDPAQIKYAAWTPDGNKAAFSLEGAGITFWDMKALEQTGSLITEPPDYAYRLALSPDGSVLYASVYDFMGNCGMSEEDKSWIRAWDITTSTLIFDNDLDGTCLQSMAVSPDGHRLGGITGYGKLMIFDATSGNIEVDQQIRYLKSLVWQGNDRILYVHNPSTPYGTQNLKSIAELDLNTMEVTSILLPGFENIYSMAWLTDSKRLVTNSAGGTISIWQATSEERLQQFQITLGEISLTNFDPASISPWDGTLATPALGSVATINLETGQVLRTMEYDASWPETQAGQTSWSADGKKLAGQIFGLETTDIVVWEAQTGKAIITIPFERSTNIHSLALSPDGTMLALSAFPQGEFRLLIWDIEANKAIISTQLPDSAHGISWINQNQVAFTCHGWIEVYDASTAVKVRTIAEGYSYAISPDRRLVAAEMLRQGIAISDFNSGKELAVLKLEPVFLNDLAISPDGKLLAALTEYGSVIIWDISGYYTP